MNLKLVIGIVVAVIITGALYFLWKKWNNDLKKLERSHTTLQNEFAHGVILDPSDVASYVSEEPEVVPIETDDDAAEAKTPTVRVETPYFLSNDAVNENRIEEIHDDSADDEGTFEPTVDPELEALRSDDSDGYVLSSEQPTEPLFDEDAIVFTDIEEDEPAPEVSLTPEPVQETKTKTKPKLKLKLKPKIVALKKN